MTAKLSGNEHKVGTFKADGVGKRCISVRLSIVGVLDRSVRQLATIKQ
jgi:hypothetical protein